MLNAYGRQMTESEVAEGVHRQFVGGLWEPVGHRQFEFLVERGLKPSQRLLDVGCGCLRGGIHFVRYLDPGNYYGIDVNASLIQAAERFELPAAGLTDRCPHLLVDGQFTFTRFATTFPVAIALSVFTHLPANSIERCLVRLAEVIEPGGRFYASYFESPRPHHVEPLAHPGGVRTHCDADPFHYHFSLFPFLIEGLPWSVHNLGDWQHPRSQHMLEFTRK
ncbi:MAG: class I SAM-dependent methyltransferase [Pirellulales bacterium]|nr:class I SAM-dependent methyltransferase [Pirellulales bacterium]